MTDSRSGGKERRLDHNETIQNHWGHAQMTRSQTGQVPLVKYGTTGAFLRIIIVMHTFLMILKLTGHLQRTIGNQFNISKTGKKMKYLS